MNETFIIDKYHSIVDDLCDKNNYDNNVRHLLYLVLPAFILKYGIKNERIILDCFYNTHIFVDNKNNFGIEAYFDRKLENIDDQIVTQKYIVITGFEKESYIYLIDSIIHEFNHALNSINNEIEVNDEGVKLRTGLSYVIYGKNNVIKNKKAGSTL